MKRILLILLIVAAASIPAFSDFRADINIQVPALVGYIYQGDIELYGGAEGTLLAYPVPFPSVGLYYEINLGFLKLCPGIRVYTLLVQSALFPNILAEFDLHPLYIQAQIGGLFFYTFGILGSAAETGEAFIPDVSAWFGFGESGDFRIGLGVIGLYLPDVVDDGMLICPYIGGQWSVNF